MSEELERRLKDCFRTVFPDLPEASISSASQVTVPAWDSVATITLINVIEEEFGFELDLDRSAEFDSFARLLDQVQSQAQIS